MEREFDVVVFGASGFVGSYVVQELANSSRNRCLKFAVTGRDSERLKAALRSIQKYLVADLDITDIPTIVADVCDAVSVHEMCERTKILLNCVGKYKFTGEVVVAACMSTGTHLVDLAAEVEYLETTQAKYFHDALEKNVYVVQACGFGSLPNDFGISLLKRQFDGELHFVESYFQFPTSSEGFVVHSGTWSSIVDSVNDIFDIVFKRKTPKLIFDKKLPKTNYPLRKKANNGLLFYSSMVKSWCVWFVEPDERVIKRSQLFRYQFFGEEPVEAEVYVHFPSLYQAALMLICFGLMLISYFSVGRNLLKRYPWFFSAGLCSHDGPTRKQVEKACTRITLFGYGVSRACTDPSGCEMSTCAIEMEITGPEPAYVLTSICMVQAALVILEEKEKLPLRGGVLTPGAAFADTSLQKRLEQRGVNFMLRNLAS